MSMLYSSDFARPGHDHRQCVDSALTTAERICREQGQRFTPIRRQVFELIWQQHKPVGAYLLLEQLQQQGRVAPPTVYRALDFLLGLNLIHRIASLNAFVGCTHPGAAHQGYFLICRSCKASAELTADAITTEIDRSAARCGFTVLERSVEVMGLCPECSVVEEAS